MTTIAAASACLLGINCRWDGRSSPDKKLMKYLQEIIPFCPEQMGGLTTPREPAQIVGGNGLDVLNGRAGIINASGRDVTSEFVSGARKALEIIKLNRVSHIILKDRSPSCGVHHIHQGKFILAGMGVSCALFEREGFQVLSAEEIDELWHA
jgi:uncharacterized protein YbbK (DUF523 family)